MKNNQPEFVKITKKEYDSFNDSDKKNVFPQNKKASTGNISNQKL